MMEKCSRTLPSALSPRFVHLLLSGLNVFVCSVPAAGTEAFCFIHDNDKRDLIKSKWKNKRCTQVFIQQ